MNSLGTQNHNSMSNYSRLTLILIALVAIAYLAQIATPLRLIGDGIDYLLQSSSAIDGHGFLVHGVRSMRPPGYPALIVLAGKVGVANSYAIVALNCLFLGLGCWASYFLLRDGFAFTREFAEVIVLLTLLSFVMIRNVTYPLSDICFFGLATSCLLLLLRAELNPSHRFSLLAFALVLMIISIEVRTIGVALLPAFVWAAIGGNDGARRIAPRLRQYQLACYGVLVFGLVAGGVALFHSRYMRFNLPIFLHRGVWLSIVSNIKDHTTEWGEMFLNAPGSKLPGILALPLQLAGAAAILICVLGIFRKPRRVDVIRIYFIASAAVVFVYPWYDARLWVPLIPFILAFAFQGLETFIPRGTLKPLTLVYAVCFGLLGAAALAYSTRLTFAGDRFPEMYGDGKLRATYRVAWFGKAPQSDADIDPDALYLLRRFDPRAARP